MRFPLELVVRRLRQKQILLCVPRPPDCGGTEKARDSVRDDSRTSGYRTLLGMPSQVLLLDLGHGVGAGEDCVEHLVFAEADVFEQIGLH